MIELWNELTGWLGPWFWWLAAISAVMVVLGTLLLPFVIIRMPADYFLRDESPSRWSHDHPAARLAIRVGRNVLGVALVLAGIIMLVTPGQGLLTILAGLWLVDLPRKREIERRIVAMPLVLKTLNLIRRKARKPPLAAPTRQPKETAS